MRRFARETHRAPEHIQDAPVLPRTRQFAKSQIHFHRVAILQVCDMRESEEAQVFCETFPDTGYNRQLVRCGFFPAHHGISEYFMKSLGKPEFHVIIFYYIL
jgi:deoxycytidylate deaminase